MWFKILSAPTELWRAYGDGYAATNGTDLYMTGDAARALFRKVLRAIEPRDTPGRTLLDIGTGQGALLEEAEALGYQAQGIDLCEPLVRKARARGLRVECARAEDLDAAGRFDVVTMMDVIEHVPEPRRLLAVARRLLTAGGTLVVYTPNHRSAIVVLARMLHRLGAGFAVREIFGGNHICFFDDRSLPRALGGEGFSVARLTVFPYDPSRPGGPISRVSLSAVRGIEWLARPFHRTFRMLAIATK